MVQFRATSLPEWRETLAGLGIEILASLPHNGHIIRTEAERLAEIHALEFVERVEPYHPSYRLEPELRATFLLRAHHGLPFRAVAEALGISERAAKDRFRRTRDQLARRLSHLVTEDD